MVDTYASLACETDRTGAVLTLLLCWFSNCGSVFLLLLFGRTWASLDLVSFWFVSDDIAVACIGVFGGIGGVTSFNLCFSWNSMGRAVFVPGDLNIFTSLNNPVILVGISKHIDIATAISFLFSIVVPS